MPTADLPIIHDGTGQTRVLAALPHRDDFGGLPMFATANVMTPRSQWRDIDLMDAFPVPVFDQGSHGSCVGQGSVSAFWQSYQLMGGTVPPGGFSPTSVYSLINGGRDRGAIVSDALVAMRDHGIALMSQVPQTIIYESRVSAEAKATRKRFRLQDAFHTNTFDAIGSALMLGYPVSFGIMLPGRFHNLNDEGVCGLGGGRLGGHCMEAYGLVKLKGGEWGIRVLNSWGERWGRRGHCVLVEEHFGRDLDAFAIRSALPDPQDSRPHPVAV